MGVRNLAAKHVGRKEYLMEMPAMFKGNSLTCLALGARNLGLVVVAASGIGFFPAAVPADAQQRSNSRALGAASLLGNGTVASYAEFDTSRTLKAIGVVFSASALDNLPTAPSDGHRCFDSNNDGVIDLATECSGWHERVLPLPSEASRRTDMPFKWALLNWNPHGHIPAGIYDVPHFDVHFYIEPIENVFAIQRGPCGVEFARCDQFARAKLPLPKNYMHADFKDVDAVAPAMGNHLVDQTAHEFHGVPFNHTWIYGAYDGRVTFYEEMLTLAYLKSHPKNCFPIKTTPAVALTGYYPTKSCIRYVKKNDKEEYTVSLEDFQLRQGSPPEAEAVTKLPTQIQ